MNLRDDCNAIVREAIAAMQPDAAVQKALRGRSFGTGRIVTVAAGKAAWTMAAAAKKILGARMESGVVVTKYDHSKGGIEGMTIFEAGHPVPDENSFAAAREALNITRALTENDTVLFLLSGGCSALFESPLISGGELTDITNQLLACGADIVEINTIRKRLSAVKGGKFAAHCAPAKVFSIVLSDIIGDPLDMIGSGPAYPDTSTCAQAQLIVEKYHLRLTPRMADLLTQETPKHLDNVETLVTGSVTELCYAAAAACKNLGYEPTILTDRLTCEAREAGRFLSAIAKSHENSKAKLAFLAGGETVVHLTGHGMGGRNQELALSACEGIDDMQNAAIFSLGSDGTDGPTDAAGGYVDGTTLAKLENAGLSLHDVLSNNDAYHALEKTDGLLITGATGTNVNDVAIVLLGRHA